MCLPRVSWHLPNATNFIINFGKRFSSPYRHQTSTVYSSSDSFWKEYVRLTDPSKYAFAQILPKYENIFKNWYHFFSFFFFHVLTQLSIGTWYRIAVAGSAIFLPEDMRTLKPKTVISLSLLHLFSYLCIALESWFVLLSWLNRIL